MLENILLEFLYRYKTLELPGIGVLSIEETPSAYNYGEKLLSAPVARFVFQQTTENNPRKAQKIIQFLVDRLQRDEVSVADLWDNFSKQSLSSLTSEGCLRLKNIGSFTKGQDGIVSFDSAFDSRDYYQDISATYVVQKDKEILLKVGDADKTESEMESLLETSKKRNKYWVLWLILGLILLLGIVGGLAFWFYIKGLIKLT